MEFTIHHSYYQMYPFLKKIFPPSVSQIREFLDNDDCFAEDYTLIVTVPTYLGQFHGSFKVYLEYLTDDGFNRKVHCTGSFDYNTLHGLYHIYVTDNELLIFSIDTHFTHNKIDDRLYYIYRRMLEIEISEYRNGKLNYTLNYTKKINTQNWLGVEEEHIFDFDLSKISYPNNLFLYNELQLNSSAFNINNTIIIYNYSTKITIFETETGKLVFEDTISYHIDKIQPVDTYQLCFRIKDYGLIFYYRD